MMTLIMSPMESRIRYWKNFMVVLSAYSAWTYPFESSFLPPSAQIRSLKKFYTADSIISFFFLLDLLLTFFVAYFDPNARRLVRDWKKIAVRYLTTWFVVDVASTLPLQLVSHNMCSVLGLIRLSRLRHVKQFLYRLQADIRFSYFWVTFAKVLCVTLFAVHYHSLQLLHAGERLSFPGSVFLMIYLVFFKVCFPGYAIICMIDLIHEFFDSPTVKPDIEKSNAGLIKFLEVLPFMYEEGLVNEDENMFIHSMIDSWLENVE